MGYSVDTIYNAETLANSLVSEFLASSPPTSIWADDFFVLYGQTSWGGDTGTYITNMLAYWFLHNYVISKNVTQNNGSSNGNFLTQSLSIPDLSVVFKHPDNLDLLSSYLYQTFWGTKLLFYIKRFYLTNIASCV